MSENNSISFDMGTTARQVPLSPAVNVTASCPAAAPSLSHLPLEAHVSIRPARSYYASSVNNSASTSSYEEDVNVSHHSRSCPAVSDQIPHNHTVSDQEYWESELQAQA